MITSFQCDYPEINDLLKITEDINHINDIYSLLDRLLYETRRFLRADAGSIYLKEHDLLRFSYVQNDTLYAQDRHFNKNIYSDITLPIDKKSIAGYVALSGEPLNIQDVYKLERDAPYTFNKSFDDKSSYRTVSLLTLPLVTGRGIISGIIQLINAKKADGTIVPFSDDDVVFGEFFANNASVAIEKAKLNREAILRMVKMSELRDPRETGNHVNRVGSYSVEIYHSWAREQGINEDQIRHFKDNLRIAAMLHDVGKVAIPDSILKKPGPLNDDEYKTMKTHSYQGYKLFADPATDVDKLTGEVILNHHEKFDGSGYPNGKKGEEIPLGGRIVAIADVYDALINRRAYKEAWEEQKVLDLLQEESGRHFDPQLVTSFFDSYDTIKAVANKFQDS